MRTFIPFARQPLLPVLITCLALSGAANAEQARPFTTAPLGELAVSASRDAPA